VASKAFVAGIPSSVSTVFVEICKQQGYDVTCCEDRATALVAIEEQSFDLVCLGSGIKNASPFDLCKIMRRHSSWRDCPIVLVTDRPESGLIEKAFSAGFSESFSSTQLDALATFITRYGNYRRSIEGRVLLVEDSAVLQQVVKLMLVQVGLEVVCSESVKAAQEELESGSFDLIITDVVLKGDLTGLDLIARVRRMEGVRGDVPVLVMSNYQSSAQRLAPFRIGADDYISKPVDGDALTARSLRLIESYQLLVTVRDQQRKQEKTNHLMGQMLSRVSHECRNSMNIILGVSKLLLRKNDVNKDQTNKIEMIINAGKHQLSLLNDILDYTKLNSGDIDFRPSITAVGEIVSEAVGLFEQSCEDRGLTMEFSVSPEVPEHCFLDVRLVKQVLINLLANAAKYTTEGRVSVSVAVDSVLNKGPMLVFSVRDTGRGIAREELRLLFSEFKQSRIGHEVGGGTGLGLSLCLGFAQVMGGEIDVRSAVGKGSEFLLRLPLVEKTR